MRFQTSIVALAGCLSLSLASPAPEPQSPAQTEAAVSEILSYEEALATNTAALAFATDEALLSQFVQIQSSIQNDIQAGIVPGTSALGVLPTAAQNFFLSVYTVEASIFSKHGFSASATGTGSAGSPGSASMPSPTTAKSTGGAAPTTVAKIGAGLAAGFMGVVMAL